MSPPTLPLQAPAGLPPHTPRRASACPGPADSTCPRWPCSSDGAVTTATSRHWHLGMPTWLPATSWGALPASPCPHPVALRAAHGFVKIQNCAQRSLTSSPGDTPLTGGQPLMPGTLPCPLPFPGGQRPCLAQSRHAVKTPWEPDASYLECPHSQRPLSPVPAPAQGGPAHGHLPRVGTGPATSAPPQSTVRRRL